MGKNSHEIPVTIKLYGSERLIDGVMLPEQSTDMLSVKTYKGEIREINVEDIESMTMLGMEVRNPYSGRRTPYFNHLNTTLPRVDSRITDEEFDSYVGDINRQIEEDIKKHKENVSLKMQKEKEKRRFFSSRSIGNNRFELNKFNIISQIVELFDQSDSILFVTEELETGDKKVGLYFKFQ